MSIDDSTASTPALSIFDPETLPHVADQISRARRRILVQQARLNLAIPFRRGALLKMGDPEALDADEAPGPMLVAEYNKRAKTWELKVASVTRTGNRIEIYDKKAVALLQCPSNLVLHFGLGDEMKRLVDHEIALERARMKVQKTAKPRKARGRRAEKAK